MTVVVDTRRIAHDRAVPLNQRLARVALLLFALDSAVILGATALGWHIRGVTSFLTQVEIPEHWSDGLNAWVALIWIGCLASRSAYRRTSLGSGYDEYRAVTVGSLMALMLIGSTAFMFHNPLSRGFLLITIAIGTPSLLLSRYAVRKVIHALRRRGHLRSRVIAVCEPGALSEVTATLDRMDHVGYSVVGTCAPGGSTMRDLDRPIPCYGNVDDVLSACQEAGADTVLVAGGGYTTSQALRRVGWALEGQNIDLIVVPSLIDVAGPRIHMRQIGGLPLVHVQEPQVGRAGGWLKRTFDFVIAAALTVLVSPLMVLIAIVVKLQDGGPVFFRQERSGQHAQRFLMTKFRSMVPDAEVRLEEFLHETNAGEVLFKLKEDPRVTRFGRFIRRYSLDELPQLFDVLRGDMSLVGPRPPLPREVEQYPADMNRRLLVRPGLTGLWQVSGRSDLSFEEAVRMDLYYVDNWSITGDVIIMLKTVRAVLFARGAY